MEIIASDCWKRFGKEWVFKNFTFHFEEDKSYAVVGNNGSGKSTLLKALAATMPLNKGKFSYTHQQKAIEQENLYRYMTFAGPYTELVEELTLQELLKFYQHFKKLALSEAELTEVLALPGVLNKPIRFYSSGMKQKVKLGLAFFTDCPLLLLDEPTSNFDRKNARWYADTVRSVRQKKLVIICSNQPEEYEFCDEILDMGSFK